MSHGSGTLTISIIVGDALVFEISASGLEGAGHFDYSEWIGVARPRRIGAFRSWAPLHPAPRSRADRLVEDQVVELVKSSKIQFKDQEV